jgi:hypothetical protein
MSNELITKPGWEFLNQGGGVGQRHPFEVLKPLGGMVCNEIGAQNNFRHSSAGSDPWNASVGCQPWQKVQWEASFKDVPFAVDTDSRSGGRRIHVHEYPSKEWWDNEDLGRLRQQIQIEGYVFGDQCDLWAELLFAACTDPLKNTNVTGAGLLYLPMRVPMWAVCQTVESSFHAERMGRIDFSMSFSVEPRGEAGSVPTAGNHPSPLQLAYSVHRASGNVVSSALARFNEVFTGTQPSVARTTAANYIRGIGQNLLKAAGAVRLNEKAGAIVKFISQRFIDNASAFATVQRTAANTMTKTAAVQAQQASGLSAYSEALRGVAVRASTGEVLPAQGKMGEGFGGMLVNGFAALQTGTTSNASDLAMALIPMTNIKPRIQRALSAAQLSTASVKAELALAETVCSLTRRLALAYSIRAGIDVAPARQPDASLTRRRLLEQLDEEIALLPSDTDLQDNLRKLRRTVPDFVAHYSAGGNGSVRLPTSWAGKPLAAIAASVYGRNAAGRDVDLMRFNGITHPMFAPQQMVALTEHGMSLVTGI